MKTILTLALIATLLAGSVYYISQDSYTEDLEAYEDDIIFRQGTVYWELNGQNLDNEQIVSIGKSIGRKRIQKWVGTDYIYGLELNISNNKSISDISELLFGITKGLSAYLTSLTINIDDDSFNWDTSFKDWALPAKVTKFDFSASTNTASGFTNLLEVVKNSNQPLTTLNLGLYNNSFSSFYKFFEEIKGVQNSVQDFQINLGYNYSSANSSQLQSNLNEFLDNNYALTSVNIGLAKMAVKTTYLNSLESILFDRADEGNLRLVKLDLRDNNLSETEVNEIFADLKDVLGDNLKIYL